MLHMLQVLIEAGQRLPDGRLRQLCSAESSISC
jgi:hypothetical protein